jgi:uncharacterized paraquat-inducible protein A
VLALDKPKEIAEIKESIEKLTKEVSAMKLQPQQSTQCFSCGKMGHTSRFCKQVECYRCHARGHLQRNCPKNVEWPAKRPAKF